MPEIIPNVHPILVHFTIALITTSLGTLILSWLCRGWEKGRCELLIVSRWCLWLGALVSVLTVIAGFQAFYTVGHDAISHQVMTVHRNWGIGSFILIWLVTLWSFVLYLRDKTPCCLFALVLLVATVFVMITGWYGGELVYRYGTGVKSLPQRGMTEQQQNKEILSVAPEKLAREGGHAGHKH